MTTNNKLALKPQTLELAKNLNGVVLSVLGQKEIEGFERAFLVASAITQLSDLLTPEYMKPIMAMQGNKLGFLTDKDKSGGYPEATVKNCVIEAVLKGLQVAGNHFNIISGQMYPTKEGLGYLLNNFDGLDYNVVCGLPNINATKTSASIEVTINWTLNGAKKQQVIPIPLKMDQYTSVDALIGKATRKARAWLLSTITGVEITDGEVTDAVVIESKPLKSKEDTEAERILLMLKDCKTEAEVDQLMLQIPDADPDLFNQRKAELKESKK